MSIKERVRSWLGVSPRSGYVPTDEDRDQSVEIRRIKAEQKRLREQLALERERFELKKAQIELAEQMRELQEDDDDEEPTTDFESMLAPMLLSMFAKNNNNQLPASNIGIPQETVSQVNYSNEELETIIKQVPAKNIKLARSMPEEIVRKYIRAHMPAVNDDTIERALILIKR